jgi:hypothetical protein
MLPPTLAQANAADKTPTAQTNLTNLPARRMTFFDILFS